MNERLARTSSARWVLVCLLAASAAGQDEDDLDLFLDDELDALILGQAPVAAGEEASSLSDWKGFFELRPRVFLRDRGGDKKDEQLRFAAELELSFRFSEDSGGYFRPRVYADALDGDLSRFEPFEAWVEQRGDGWDLRAGQMVENWGIVDTFNPIDVINRRDFATDFLDAERLGELGLRLRGLWGGGETFGEPTLSLYALPVFRPTRFPTQDDRFAFGTESAAFDEDAGFQPGGAERGLYALRYQSTLNTAPFNADLQLLAARGPDRFPNLMPLAAGLVPVYHGAASYGGGLRAVPNEDVLGHFLSTLTLKLEVVYRDLFSFDDAPQAAPDDHLAWVLGVDRLFDGVLADADQLTLTLEYAGENGAGDPAARLRPFRSDWIARVFWEANDFARSSVELRGLWDRRSHESIFEGLFERQLRALHEDLKLRVQLQLFDPPGTGESLFDFFPNNSSLLVGLRFDF